jgi:hypothetical protein
VRVLKKEKEKEKEKEKRSFYFIFETRRGAFIEWFFYPSMIDSMRYEGMACVCESSGEKDV